MARPNYCSAPWFQVDFVDGKVTSWHFATEGNHTSSFAVPFRLLDDDSILAEIRRIHLQAICDSERIPDGSYVIPITRRRLLALDAAFTAALPDQPAIPMLLQVFSLSLSNAIYEECFLPAYLDLQNAYARGRGLDQSPAAIRWLRGPAFTVRAIRIALECLIRDWLCLSWRQLAWLAIGTGMGLPLARWIFGMF